MAQASSVQREPSMEEILASIRRIIEDSDTARKQSEELVPRSVAVPAPAKADIETFRAELGQVAGPGADRRPAAPAPAPSVSAMRNPIPVSEFTPKTFRLAEMQAQVAKEAGQSKAAEADRKPITMA